MAEQRKSAARKRPTSKESAASKKLRGEAKRKSPADTGRNRRARSAPDNAPGSAHFSQARSKAEHLLHDPEASEALVEKARERTKGKRAGKLSKVTEELKAMLRLVPAYVRGDYRGVSWESMVLVVAALVYLVSPIDLIPDFLPAGLADDATVVMFVAGLVHEELEDFIEWEKRQRGDDGLAGAPVPA
jgi:uncharacterized membrane protein YkvA (DUF1232 family)